MKIRREIKIGLLVVVGLALLYYGFNFLSGENVFKKSREFVTVYSDVRGLVIANPILINGYKVGQITDIYFYPEDSLARVIVKYNIDEDLPIPDNSVAVVESDLIGNNIINVRLGDSKNYIKSGDTLTGDLSTTLQEEVSLQMLPIKRKAENLMLSLDSVLAVIQYIFNDDTRENIAKSFESIKLTIKNLESTTYNIDTLVFYQRFRLERIIGNIESISLNIKNSNDKITNIIENFSTLSDTLAKAEISQTIFYAKETLDKVSAVVDKVNKGEGSLGLLINNDSLYNNLESATKELDELIEDIKINPNRYLHFSLFGKSSKKNPYVPDENKK